VSRDWVLLPLIVLGFTAWHMRDVFAAAIDAWQRSPRRHPRQVGPMSRPDLNERHHRG
jgi:hypothetical protein